MSETVPAAQEEACARAIAAHRTGHVAEAERLYRQALAQQPTHTTAWRHLGALLCQGGRFEEGAAAFREHLALSPESGSVCADLARALRCLGHLDEALQQYERAVRLAPTEPSHWREWATSLVSAGRLPEAIAALQGAANQVPDAGLLLMLGGLAQAAGHIDLAHDTYTRGLEVAESDAAQARRVPELLFRRTALSLQRGEPESGRKDAARLLELAPDYPYAAGLELYLTLMTCEWSGLDARVSQGLAAVRAGRAALPPWTVIASADDPEEQRRAARIWVATTCGKAGPPLTGGARHAHSRLRLAYLSADFGDHPVAHALAPLIERHSRATFEVIGVSIAPQPAHPVLARLAAACDEFLDVSSMTDRAAALRLREREVDVLVDLTGYTARGRPNILAARPAPLQVNFLGYPGTMGAPFMDLIVADRIVIPQPAQAWFDERVGYLPGCVLPPAEPLRPRAVTPPREALGLPHDAIVLAAFHTAYKLNPTLFAAWLRILARVPRAVLWLASVRPPVRERLHTVAAAAGIDPQRLIFAPRVDPVESHLARLAAADLYLDTLPYNAHTSAADALRAGVPVLTCAGQSFAARIGASLLTELGLPELITDSLEDYERRAVELAQDGARRHALRERLARINAGGGRSIDGYCRHLEALLLEAYRRHTAATLGQ